MSSNLKNKLARFIRDWSEIRQEGVETLVIAEAARSTGDARYVQGGLDVIEDVLGELQEILDNE